MAETLTDSQTLESTTVGIYRTATVVKGGRRFSFSALIVVGDRNGSVGYGYGKAPGVPAAIEKAQKEAKKNVFKVSLNAGTLPHPVTGKFGASKVRLIPASPGTGVIAGGTVRAVLEMTGVRDCLTKAYGSTNQKNLCKAVMQGLQSLRTRDDIAALRGVTIETSIVDEKLAAGEKYIPTASTSATKAAAPQNVVGKQKGGRGRGGRGGGRRGGGGGGRPVRKPAEPTTAQTPATPAAAAAAASPPAPAGEAPPVTAPTTETPAPEAKPQDKSES